MSLLLRLDTWHTALVSTAGVPREPNHPQAHKNAKAHLERLKNPDVVIPDLTVNDLRVLELGGVRLELHYVGRNHSDNSLVMLVPKEKIVFTVDFIPIGYSEAGGRPGEMLRCGHEGHQAAQVRKVGQLRSVPSGKRRTFLRILGPWLLAGC